MLHWFVNNCHLLFVLFFSNDLSHSFWFDTLFSVLQFGRFPCFLPWKLGRPGQLEVGIINNIHFMKAWRFIGNIDMFVTWKEEGFSTVHTYRGKAKNMIESPIGGMAAVVSMAGGWFRRVLHSSILSIMSFKASSFFDRLVEMDVSGSFIICQLKFAALVCFAIVKSFVRVDVQWNIWKVAKYLPVALFASYLHPLLPFSGQWHLLGQEAKFWPFYTSYSLCEMDL